MQEKVWAPVLNFRKQQIIETPKGQDYECRKLKVKVRTHTEVRKKEEDEFSFSYAEYFGESSLGGTAGLEV